MELYFIRHAQGEHTLNVPTSLEKVHPALTPLGRKQAEALRKQLSLTERDLLVVSPTIRTLETSAILTESSNTPIYVTPKVGPRKFPCDGSWVPTLLCDYILSARAVKRRFPQTFVLYDHFKGLSNEGLNEMDSDRYGEAVNSLLEWIRLQRRDRVFLVSHDGTITDYRQRLTGETLTRDDFLGEAGYIRLLVD